MPPVVETALGFLLMLALLVGVHLGVAWVAGRLLGPSSRVLPATAGALASYLTCAGFFLAGTLGIGRQELTLRVRVLPESPAHEAGLRDGDRVLFVDGVHATAFQELPRLIADADGEPIEVEVQRGEETLRFEVQPRDGRIGVMSISERHDLPLGGAAADAITAPRDTMFLWAGDVLARVRARTGVPRPMMGPVAVVAPDPSPWPRVLRLGHLAAYAWPLALFLCFSRGLRRQP
jgi:membrane-associated protease RseP (regulator of RpoE activity)